MLYGPLDDERDPDEDRRLHTTLLEVTHRIQSQATDTTLEVLIPIPQMISKLTH